MPRRAAGTAEGGGSTSALVGQVAGLGGAVSLLYLVTRC